MCLRGLRNLDICHGVSGLQYVGCRCESVANSEHPIGALARRLLGIFGAFYAFFEASPVDK